MGNGIDVSEHVPLAYWFAYRIRNRPTSVPIEETHVFDCAILGLVKAAKCYDPNRPGVVATFATYATRAMYLTWANELRTQARDKRRAKVYTLEHAIGNASYDEQLADHATAADLWDDLETVVSERDAEITRRRMQGETLVVIGAAVGVTKERVRQIVERTIRLMQEKYADGCD